MAIENWIDELVDVAGSVRSDKGDFVRAYYVFKRAEIPEALEKFPCALTYGTVVHPKYGDSISTDLWEGVTEFHLFADTKKTNFPEIQRYFGKIRNAFAAKRTLGGKVAHLAIQEQGIELHVGTYGSEVEHHMLMVYWEVKENVSAEVTLGM